jgi:TonB dependent receptor
VRREAYDVYVQDAWKASPRWNITYGLRYEINSRIRDSENRNSIAFPVGGDGRPVPFFTPGANEVYLYNPRPVYPMDWGGWGPRAAVDFAATNRTIWHGGAAITTLLPNIFLDNYVTSWFPLIFPPVVTAQPGLQVPFSNTAVPLALPPIYSTAGRPLFANGNASRAPANTPIDVDRFEHDVEALTPGHEPQLLLAAVMSRDFRNGYIGTHSLGVDHDFSFAKLSARYMGTAGIDLPNVAITNGYSGADPSYAPFTEFDSSGQAIGGYGPEYVMSSSAHSSYNALQTSLSKSDARLGLEFQASYTFSKSIDDTSTLLGGVSASPGATVQTFPQDPRNLTALTSGSPFTVYSGIQQTGAGAGGSDRPDLVAEPKFSTSGPMRDDYFGRSANNSSFFSIPIHVPSGTGPNQGVFGTLGQDAFRGPGFLSTTLR